MSDPCPPTLAAAQARIGAFRPAAYARTRNAIDGAVSGLSPYITHGLVSSTDVLAGVAPCQGQSQPWKFSTGFSCARPMLLRWVSRLDRPV
jgi:deoxyribodipyrimidine photo-lyase